MDEKICDVDDTSESEMLENEVHIRRFVRIFVWRT